MAIVCLFYYEFYDKLIIVSTSFEHLSCPYAKANATNHCPIVVDCCVSFLGGWTSVGRPEPDTLAAGSAPAYPFFVDRGGYCIQFNPHPCNNRTHPFLHYPYANSDGGVDCCVIVFVSFQFPSPISCNEFIKKTCELRRTGQLNDPRPSSPSGNCSP